MTPSLAFYVVITLVAIYHAILSAMLGRIAPVALKHYHTIEAEDTISLSSGIIIALWLITVFYAIVVGVVLTDAIILLIMKGPIQTLQPTATDVHAHMSTSSNIACPEDHTQTTTKPTRSFLVQGRNIAKDLHSSSSSDEEPSGDENKIPHPHWRRASSKPQAPPIEDGRSDSGSVVPNCLTPRQRGQICRKTVERGHNEHIIWLRSEVLDRYLSVPLEGEELNRGTTEENIPVSMRKLRLSLP